jgi:hypothetical protein
VLDPKRVQARVNAFGLNANVPDIEVWMEPQTSIRKKPKVVNYHRGKPLVRPVRLEEV